MLALYSGLLYGLYVPDWQFAVSGSTSSLPPIDGGNIYTVRVGSAPSFLPSLSLSCLLCTSIFVLDLTCILF